jgi:thioredoxin-related protein
MIRKSLWIAGFGIVLSIGLAVLQWPAASASNSIRWYGYDEGMALGRNHNKKVVIHFYADWCGYCRKMDRKTYRNRKVADFLGSHFVAIRVNTDKEPRIASIYGVRGLPSTWFLTGKGEKISNLPGYIAPDLFMDVLTYIQTESYKTMSFKKFLTRS